MKNFVLCSEDIHERTYEETKNPATYSYQSSISEPIIKKTVVNKELVSNFVIDID